MCDLCLLTGINQDLFVSMFNAYAYILAMYWYLYYHQILSSGGISWSASVGGMGDALSCLILGRYSSTPPLAEEDLNLSPASCASTLTLG